MVVLKTNKEELLMFNDFLLKMGDKLAPKLKDIIPRITHDALHAHAYKAKLDKILAMKPENHDGAFPKAAGHAFGANRKLKEIQAILNPNQRSSKNEPNINRS